MAWIMNSGARPKTEMIREELLCGKFPEEQTGQQSSAAGRNLDLEKNPKVMMIGMISRLTDQKGFDLVDYVMDELCQDAVQIVVLGTGDAKYENMFRHFAWKYSGKVSANIFYVG